MSFPRDNWWTRFRVLYALWRTARLVADAQLRGRPKALVIFSGGFEVGEQWN